MKAYLMYSDRDFDPEQPLPANTAALTQDLELNTLFSAMARGDAFVFNVVRTAALCGLNDLETIRYRQAILQDCLNNPSVVREIYQIPIEAAENRRKIWSSLFTDHPSWALTGSVDMMQMLMGELRRLKAIADDHAGQFASEGFTRFFAMLKRELDEEYFTSVQDHLRALKFPNGILLSAELGAGNEGTGYVLRKPAGRAGNWLKWALAQLSTPAYIFYLHPRDDAGARALEALRDRGLNLVANAMAQSVAHVQSFLTMLQTELAFYIGGLNLHERLAELGAAGAFPVPAAPAERRHAFRELYDICLALTLKRSIVGNTVAADDKDLVIITGANQGGKSTFLRSIGLAQLMMQCGLFVPAESFSANLCTGLFTHYKRKEDASMESGKLDEELSRMSVIADQAAADSLVLFNESFAATNEREGSEIARQITRALLEGHVKAFFVTHQYEFAHGWHANGADHAAFLRAERQPDGTRTFKLVEGEPLQTSYGEDLYDQIFMKGRSRP